jgi:thiosulfate dehydrogenase [quinone] large subunit
VSDSIQALERESAVTAGIGLGSRRSDAVIAYTILRLSFGANIMLHGVSRLIVGQAGFLAYLQHYFEKTPAVPAALLPLFAAVLPFAETALGLLTLIGLATRWSLIAGALVMTMLVIGTNLAQDWNVAGLQLIYCFLYYYLLVHRAELNRYSLDALWRKSG